MQKNHSSEHKDQIKKVVEGQLGQKLVASHSIGSKDKLVSVFISKHCESGVGADYAVYKFNHDEFKLSLPLATNRSLDGCMEVVEAVAETERKRELKARLGNKLSPLERHIEPDQLGR